MTIVTKSILLPALLAFPSMAADWPAIPAEVWAIKEDPAKGIKDAVILEERTILNKAYMERVRRVRILSEAGRKAVEMNAFSKACYDFKGRTVYPDGKVLTFDKRQDFKEETSEVGDYSRKRTVVIPPGLTGNCIVELRWLESNAEGSTVRDWYPLPSRLGYSATFLFGADYLTLLETVEVPQAFPWGYLALPGRTQKLDVSERSGYRIYSAKNLPSFEQPPFSLSVSQDRPTFIAFFQPRQVIPQAKEGQKEYWNAVGREIWKADFESEIEKGRHYEALRKKLLQDNPSKDPLVLATKFYSALDKEIVNVSHLTFEEAAKWPKGQELPRSTDLASICEKKAASGRGMVVLLYHLLKDSGASPMIAFLADRDAGLFRPSLFNPWQATHAVVVIEEPGKGMLLLDPSQRFAAPGLVHPDFQGVQGLLLNPYTNWSAQPFTVPIQPAAFNQKRFEYSLDIGEEEDRFKVNAQFTGFPEFAERRRYDENEQVERNRKLKERFEKQISGASIQKAEVQNAADSTANLGWMVEGQIERESRRQRHVAPFPGLYYPVTISDSMPTERTLPIVMPFLQTQSARSSFKIPKGFKVHTGQAFEKRNSFGSVEWSADVQTQGEEALAVVTFKVSVDSMFAGPAAYEGLKTYLGWITEAYKRTIILEKI